MKNTTSKQVSDYNLIATSYHESGHTVCALYNYMQVFNVSVMAPENKEGSTDFFTYSSIEEDDANKITVFEIQAYYAGLVAEKLYYRDISGSSKFPMHLRIGSSSDIRNASKLIRKHILAAPGNETFLFKKQLFNNIEQMLIEHWDAIKLIAHSLHKKKRLTYDELKYLLTRKTNHKDFWKRRFKVINIIHNNNSLLSKELFATLII